MSNPLLEEINDVEIATGIASRKYSSFAGAEGRTSSTGNTGSKSPRDNGVFSMRGGTEGQTGSTSPFRKAISLGGRETEVRTSSTHHDSSLSAEEPKPFARRLPPLPPPPVPVFSSRNSDLSSSSHRQPLFEIAKMAAKESPSDDEERLSGWGGAHSKVESGEKSAESERISFEWSEAALEERRHDFDSRRTEIESERPTERKEAEREAEKEERKREAEREDRNRREAEREERNRREERKRMEEEREERKRMEEEREERKRMEEEREAEREKRKRMEEEREAEREKRKRMEEEREAEKEERKRIEEEKEERKREERKRMEEERKREETRKEEQDEEEKRKRLHKIFHRETESSGSKPVPIQGEILDRRLLSLSRPRERIQTEKPSSTTSPVDREQKERREIGGVIPLRKDNKETLPVSLPSFLPSVPVPPLPPSTHFASSSATGEKKSAKRGGDVFFPYKFEVDRSTSNFMMFARSSCGEMRRVFTMTIPEWCYLDIPSGKASPCRTILILQDVMSTDSVAFDEQTGHFTVQPASAITSTIRDVSRSITVAPFTPSAILARHGHRFFDMVHESGKWIRKPLSDVDIFPVQVVPVFKTVIWSVIDEMTLSWISNDSKTTLLPSCDEENTKRNRKDHRENVLHIHVWTLYESLRDGSSSTNHLTSEALRSLDRLCADIDCTRWTSLQEENHHCSAVLHREHENGGGGGGASGSSPTKKMNHDHLHSPHRKGKELLSEGRSGPASRILEIHVRKFATQEEMVRTFLSGVYQSVDWVVHYGEASPTSQCEDLASTILRNLHSSPACPQTRSFDVLDLKNYIESVYTEMPSHEIEAVISEIDVYSCASTTTSGEEENKDDYSPFSDFFRKAFSCRKDVVAIASASSLCKAIQSQNSSLTSLGRFSAFPNMRQTAHSHENLSYFLEKISSKMYILSKLYCTLSRSILELAYYSGCNLSQLTQPEAASRGMVAFVNQIAAWCPMIDNLPKDHMQPGYHRLTKVVPLANVLVESMKVSEHPLTVTLGKMLVPFRAFGWMIREIYSLSALRPGPLPDHPSIFGYYRNMVYLDATSSSERKTTNRENSSLIRDVERNSSLIRDAEKNDSSSFSDDWLTAVYDDPTQEIRRWSTILNVGLASWIGITIRGEPSTGGELFLAETGRGEPSFGYFGIDDACRHPFDALRLAVQMFLTIKINCNMVASPSAVANAISMSLTQENTAIHRKVTVHNLESFASLLSPEDVELVRERKKEIFLKIWYQTFREFTTNSLRINHMVYLSIIENVLTHTFGFINHPLVIPIDGDARKIEFESRKGREEEKHNTFAVGEERRNFLTGGKEPHTFTDGKGTHHRGGESHWVGEGKEFHTGGKENRDTGGKENRESYISISKFPEKGAVVPFAAAMAAVKRIQQNGRADTTTPAAIVLHPPPTPLKPDQDRVFQKRF